MKEVKLRRPRLTEEERKEILIDYDEQELSIQEIIEKHHISRATIYRLLKEQVN